MEHRPRGSASTRGEFEAAKHGRRRGRIVAATLGSSCLVLGALGTPVGPATAAHVRHHGGHNAFKQVNLVSDIKGRAQLLDKEVKNPWGIAFGPKSSPTPLWVDNQFNPNFPADLTTKITLYAGANGKDKIAKVPLEVEA